VNISVLDEVKLGPFLIDRYEITNRQFEQFVASGGYRRPDYWKQGFVKDGRKVSREEAVRWFVDSTGRPGPSTWELGEYPPGHDDYPVNGVSWYEAAAYAEFAGKQLPTIYHWQRAAAPRGFADIAEASNFGGSGAARVGAYRGRGAFGTFDMAGNVKEWCWNGIAGQRYIRGGAWNEPFTCSPRSTPLPWDRSPQNGIRCVRYDGRAEAGLQAPVASRPRLSQKPVTDEIFRAYAVSTRTTPPSSIRASKVSTGQFLLEAREDLVCRRLRKRACPRLFIPAETWDAALSDHRVCFSQFRVRASIAPAVYLVRVHYQERASVSDPGSQGPLSAAVCDAGRGPA
jgi:hypothetical protein